MRPDTGRKSRKAACVGAALGLVTAAFVCDAARTPTASPLCTLGAALAAQAAAGGLAGISQLRTSQRIGSQGDFAPGAPSLAVRAPQPRHALCHAARFAGVQPGQTTLSRAPKRGPPAA